MATPMYCYVLQGYGVVKRQPDTLESILDPD